MSLKAKHAKKFSNDYIYAHTEVNLLGLGKKTKKNPRYTSELRTSIDIAHIS